MPSKEYWDEIYTEGRDYRVMNKLLLEHLLTNAPKHGKALDIGAGLGQLAYLLHVQGYAVTGIDLSEVAVKQASLAAEKNGANITFQQGDAEQYLTDGVFDVITCKLVFVFMRDKDTFLNRVKDHLAQNGVFIVSTPVTVKGEEYTQHYRDISIDEDELKRLLKEHFTIDNIHVEYVNFNDKYMHVACKL